MKGSLAHRLDSYELLAELMHCKIDLTECAFAKDSTDTVELAGGWRCGAELAEVESEHLNQLLEISVELLLLFVTVFREIAESRDN